MTKQRTSLFLWLSLAVIIVSLYSEYLFRDDLFVFRAVGSDTYYQYWPFDRLFGKILKSGEISHWTFQIGLGQQIFPHVAYLNPFRLLIHLMPSDFAVHMYVVKMILEIVCATFLWRLYLRKLGITGVPNVVFSLLYGFNGYLMLWGQHVNFGVIFSLIPITLYSLELFLKEGKPWALVLSLAYFMSVSIYFFTMFSLFFALFGLARLLDTTQGFTPVITKLGKLIGCCIAAGLLAAWIILPEILFYLESPRVGTPLKIGLWSHFGWMHNLSILRFFSNNLFGTDLHYYGSLNYYEAPQLYCGLLTLLMVPQFFQFANAKQRVVFGTLFLALTAALFSPYIAHLFNLCFTLNNRYTFVIIVFYLFLGASAFYRMSLDHHLNRKLFLFTWLGVFAIMLSTFFVAVAFKTGLLELSEETLLTIAYKLRGSKALSMADEIQILFLNRFIPNLLEESIKILSLLLAYGLFFWLLFKRKIEKLFPLVFILVAEVILLNYPTINERPVLEAKDLSNGRGYVDNTIEVVEYLNTIDTGFFRIAKTENSVFLNDAAFQGYFGTKGYGSLTEPATIKFYNAMGVKYYQNQKSSNYQGGFDARPQINDLMGVKYILSKKPLDEPNLKQIKKISGINIYQNLNARPLGFTYHRVWGNDAFQRLSTQERDQALLKGVVVPNLFEFQSNTMGMPEIDSLQNGMDYPPGDIFTIKDFKENHINGNISVSRPGVLFFSIPYNRGWRVKLDQEHINAFPVNFGFLGFRLNKGEYQVDLEFKPRGETVGYYTTLITMGCMLFFLLVPVLKKMGLKNRTH